MGSTQTTGILMETVPKCSLKHYIHFITDNTGTDNTDNTGTNPAMNHIMWSEYLWRLVMARQRWVVWLRCSEYSECRPLLGIWGISAEKPQRAEWPNLRITESNSSVPTKLFIRIPLNIFYHVPIQMPFKLCCYTRFLWQFIHRPSPPTRKRCPSGPISMFSFSP